MKNGFVAGIIIFLISIMVYHFTVINDLNAKLVESNKKIELLQYQVDSLNYELFPLQTELGRYEIGYEIFLQRNPEAAKQYGTIISEETE